MLGKESEAVVTECTYREQDFYALRVGTVAVLLRIADGRLNATQILRAAGDPRLTQGLKPAIETQ